MRELNIFQMEEIIGGGSTAGCAALGFILGVALGMGNPIAAMGAVVAGYLNGCY
ncbi:MAG: hypothetical protein QHH13_02735 [Melioribacter sp.]|uniref:hypothetical protein n=1 Tax=Rosettibacter primus TaxID=3111523 RepID=UPI00247D2BC7|nr:hypothetical protein [Melioribacter sp.]